MMRDNYDIPYYVEQFPLTILAATSVAITVNESPSHKQYILFGQEY